MNTTAHALLKARQDAAVAHDAAMAAADATRGALRAANTALCALFAYPSTDNVTVLTDVPWALTIEKGKPVTRAVTRDGVQRYDPVSLRHARGLVGLFCGDLDDCPEVVVLDFTEFTEPADLLVTK